MVLVNTVEELQNQLSVFRKNDVKIGFIPTMGALHQGHISLVKESVKNNDITVVSVFVNPTQFNDKSDFERYPRNIERDAQLLGDTGVDVVFAPSEKEIYPEPDTRQFDFGLLDKVMEGKFRPGHFNGVAQVVSRLFDIVKPDRAYFGEKDFQQLAIIRKMVRQLNLPVNIVGMPILRESNGLAMSSRNERLTLRQRENSAGIYAALAESKNLIDKCSVSEVVNEVSEKINNIEGLTVEYFDIVDGNSLQSVSDWSDSCYIVGCIAVFCGEVRLIDNITYLNKL